jgi:hypothetical protein
MAATVARARLQDCALARPFYAPLAVDPTSPRMARANAYLGLCAAADGKASEAAEAFARIDPALLDATLITAVTDAAQKLP